MMRTSISLHAAPFAEEFLDVEPLNAHISTPILEHLDEVRQLASRGTLLPSKALVVLGPAGGGKTHLFARMRHRACSRAKLILLRPYFGVGLSLQDVLAGVVDQLCLPVEGGSVSHLDLFSAYWLKKPEPDDAAVEHAIAKLVAIVPETAPAAHLARAILELGTLDSAARWRELAWLSGREPRSGDAGVPLSERDVLHMLRLLAVMAAPVAPLVLTFDQLENLAGDSEARVLSYGNLVAEMVDTLPALTIVQLALTSEWMQFIAPRLSLPQKSRVAHQTLLLEAPNPKERELLLRAWHDRLSRGNSNGKKLRFPSPLTHADLNALIAEPGMTPRLLLAALLRGFEGNEVLTPTSADRIDDLGWWETERAKVEHEFSDKERAGIPFDAAELAEGVASALSFVQRLEVATRTERDRLITTVKAPGHDLEAIYLTSLHHSSVASVLAKAVDLAHTGKVVIIREQRCELPRTWTAVHERRSAFESMPNARWLWLDREQTVSCLTLARVLSQARAGKLRDSAAHTPYALKDIRAQIERARMPGEWTSVASLMRWLSDVPRSPAPSEVASALAQGQPTRSTNSTTTSAQQEAARDHAGGVFEPATALREWIALGRDLGQAAAHHYLGRLRAIVRRTTK